MADISKIQVGNQIYYIEDTASGYTTVEVNNILPEGQRGDAIGTLTFNGVTYTVYAPLSSGSQNPLRIEVNDTVLWFNRSSER